MQTTTFIKIAKKKNDTKTTQKRTNNNVNNANNTSCGKSPDGESHDKEKTEYEKNSLLAAEYMAKRILREFPNYRELTEKKKDTTLKRWASDIEKLLRIDNVDFEQFKDVLAFSQTDNFWKDNIRSGTKLREKYDELAIKMRKGQS